MNVDYEKQLWIDHLETDDTHEVIQEGTVLEAKRFNHMEDGIAICSQVLNTVSEKMESISHTVEQVEEKGFVASVVHIKDEDEEEENQKLVFTMSDGQTLSVSIGASQTYQVNYYDGATLLFSDIVKSGKNSVFALTPTRPSTAQYDYTFLGWSSVEGGEVEEGLQEGITDNVNLYAVFDAEVRSYTVTFLKEGQTLYSGELEYGEAPEYDGSALTNADGRPFDKWTPEIESVKESVTYTANFKHRLRYYSGDALLETEYVGDGQTPSLGYIPTKESTAQYSYLFTGWTTVEGSEVTESSALSAMSGDRDLYAVFTQQLRTFTVTWDMNGTNQTATYYYGQTPTAPTVSAVDGRSFSSWDKTITAVTEDVTYTARYQRQVRFYNGSTLLSTKYVDYGKSLSYSGSTPTKASTAQYDYAFSGWALSPDGLASSTALSGVTSDRDVYSVFSKTLRSYTVNFVLNIDVRSYENYDYVHFYFDLWPDQYTHNTTTVYGIYNGKSYLNMVLSTQTVSYGSWPTIPSYGWSTSSSSGYHRFSYTPTVSAVTGNTTYYVKVKYGDSFGYLESISFA